MRYVTGMFALALFALVAPGANAADTLAGTTIYVNSYGGAFDDVLRETVAKPLKEKYGINVVYEPGTAMEALSKAMATKGHSHLDVLMIDSANMPTAIANGAIGKITEKDVPELRNLYAKAREFGDYGASYIFGPLVLSYNKERVKTPPASYRDLLKPEYRGKIAIFNLENNGGILTLAALAADNGGSVANMEPGFAALKKLKANIVATPAANAALNQLFQQNEATVAANWTGRILSLQASGFPVEMVVPKEGIYSGLTYVNLVNGSAHREAALKYIAQQISPAAELGMAQKFFYPPTNKLVKLTPDLAKKVVVYGPESIAKIRTLDWAAVAKHRSAWLEEWNRVMSQ
ncbi:MAG TPA: ABC transporter substrate-binding protein [Stellaceae bacterium]|nr:ABC transporter substrate-binding protein [Stellaceae bacterium]